MKQFGPLQAIWMSFYSAELYRDVARNWRGSGLLYLTIVLALCWLPTPVRWFVNLRGFATTEAPKIARQFPDINISNGVMQARPPGRHEIRFSDSSGTPYRSAPDHRRHRRPGPGRVRETGGRPDAPRARGLPARSQRAPRPGVDEPRRHGRDARRDREVPDLPAKLGAGCWLPARPDRLAGLPLRSGVPLRSAHADVREQPQRDARLRRRPPCLGRRRHARDRDSHAPVDSFLHGAAVVLRWPAGIVITALYVRFAVDALGEEPSAALPAAPPVG